MIQVEHLTKRYGNKLAVDDISFHVKKGEILGFLGPNGAGKTTTMNVLTGYISCNEGNATIANLDILEQPIEAKKHIGFLPEQPPIYIGMTVESYLRFVCGLKKISKKNVSEQVDEVCKKTKIENVRGRLIGNLSKGYRQRVGLAQALLGNPDVLILDEPTVGLDPKQIIEIRNLIKSLGKDHTIILSSHILSEIQAVCDRVIIINRGKIVANDTELNLSSKLNEAGCYVLRVAGEEKEILPLLEQVEGVSSVLSVSSQEKDACEFHIYQKSGKDPRKAIFTVLANHHCPILELHGDTLSLEDIFLKIIAEDTAMETAQQTEMENQEANSEQAAPGLEQEVPLEPQQAESGLEQEVPLEPQQAESGSQQEVPLEPQQAEPGSEQEVPLEPQQAESGSQQEVPLEPQQAEPGSEQEVPLEPQQAESGSQQEVPLEPQQAESGSEQEVPLEPQQAESGSQQEVSLEPQQEASSSEPPAEKEEDAKGGNAQ